MMASDFLRILSSFKRPYAQSALKEKQFWCRLATGAQMGQEHGVLPAQVEKRAIKWPKRRVPVNRSAAFMPLHWTLEEKRASKRRERRAPALTEAGASVSSHVNPAVPPLRPG
jgi:hypothetical protein